MILNQLTINPKKSTILVIQPTLRGIPISNVAREGLQTPHWPEKYAKYHVFSAFEADFCSKIENRPPNGIGKQKL